MSLVAKPEELLDLKPARALRIVTPPGLVLAATVPEPPLTRGRPIELRVTLAWPRGGEGAARMARWVDDAARELIGPGAPARVRAGELSSPLRDGGTERPGLVVAELSGEVQAVIDARRPGERRSLDPVDPATFELTGPGSMLSVMTYLWACSDDPDGIHAQLTAMISVTRGAPGWELWGAAARVAS